MCEGVTADGVFVTRTCFWRFVSVSWMSEQERPWLPHLGCFLSSDEV